MRESSRAPIVDASGAFTTGNDDELAVLFATLVLSAGAVVMEVFAQEKIVARIKNDSSPVSDADERAEAQLLTDLTRLLPALPIIAEESVARGVVPAHRGAFLLVDALDGTREFIARRKEFTINVALVVDGAPRAGAVYAPALGELFFAGADAYAVAAQPGFPLPSRGDWRRLHTRRAPAALTALVSRSHLDDETLAFLRRHHITDSLQAGSSLKFCRLAEGRADVYPRFGPTMEWDIAAGDAILRAAGGAVLTPQGGAFGYGKTAQAYRNGAFVAWGDPAVATIS